MTHRISRTTVATAVAAICVAAVGTVAAADMSMGDSPEHVAAAYAALQHGKLTAARMDLQTAIDTKGEPANARGHAREALAAVKAHHIATARDHAEHGAAVEHLTYALSALEARDYATAKAHLGEARALPLVHAQAKTAMADIAAHKYTAAATAIRSGLKIAKKD